MRKGETLQWSGVEVEDVAFAMKDASPERVYFLDVETGEVIPVGDEFGAGEAERERQAMTAAPDRYRRVPQLAPAEDDKDRRAFVESIEISGLRVALADVLDGKVRFAGLRQRLSRASADELTAGRYQEMLRRNASENERWYAFQEERWLERARTWLAEQGIEPSSEPKRRPCRRNARGGERDDETRSGRSR